MNSIDDNLHDFITNLERKIPSQDRHILPLWGSCKKRTICELENYRADIAESASLLSGAYSAKRLQTTAVKLKELCDSSWDLLEDLERERNTTTVFLSILLGFNLLVAATENAFFVKYGLLLVGLVSIAFIARDLYRIFNRLRRECPEARQLHLHWLVFNVAAK